MIINSDINVLGSLPDWNLINIFLKDSIGSLRLNGGLQSFTAIKTDKSIKRFEKAISGTLIKFKNADVDALIKEALISESISNDSLLLLFWNASCNNSLLNYLNNKVYFPAFYSGRVTIKNDEIIACLVELKEKEADIKKWAESTILVTASKYLILLKKFGLMSGSVNKSIVHPYLSDKMFILFVYWIVSVEPITNIIQSKLLTYSFSDKQVFIDRVLQKKYVKFFNITYTGDKMKIEPLIQYQKIYDAAAKF